MIAMSRAAFATILAAGLFVSAGPANAVVYCKTVGYPNGCVARARVARPVVVAPVHRRVVYCTRVGYPRGCVVR